MPCEEVPMQRVQQIWSLSSLCYQKKTQVHHKSNCRKPKAHQLHAGPMYAQDSANHCYSKESISDESFCLQLQTHSNQAEGKKNPQSCSSYNKPCLLLETASHQKYVLAGTVGHMHWCEHHAS